MSGGELAVPTVDLLELGDVLPLMSLRLLLDLRLGRLHVGAQSIDLAQPSGLMAVRLLLLPCDRRSVQRFLFRQLIFQMASRGFGCFHPTAKVFIGRCEGRVFGRQTGCAIARGRQLGSQSPGGLFEAGLAGGQLPFSPIECLRR